MTFLSRLLHGAPQVPPVRVPDDTDLTREITAAKEANMQAAAGLEKAMQKQSRDAVLIRQVLSGVLQRVEERELSNGSD